MDKELTFHPEKERTRDLIYSEYSSCDRSIHLLVQESSAVSYDVLLRAYRETISAYLSSEHLEAPAHFLGNLLSRFDAVSDESGVPLESWKTVGIHLLLRSVDACYLLTSRESEVLVSGGGELSPLGESGMAKMERLRLDSGERQRELFPQRVRDLFAVFRLDPTEATGRDIVLGCSAGDSGAVLETLAGPMWVDSPAASDARAARRSIVSKFVSRKILAIRFDTLVVAGRKTPSPTDGRFRRSVGRLLVQRRFVVSAAAVVVMVLVGVLWRGESQRGEEYGSPRVSSGDRASTPVPDAGTPVSGGATASPVDEDGVTLVESWRKAFQSEVTSSPVVFEEWVIFGCRDGNVYALEKDKGGLVWKFAASSGIGASPVIHGEWAIVADYNGQVYAVNAREGREMWSRKLPKRVVSSPEVAGDRVLVGCYDGYAYCLSVADGRVLWKAKTKGRIRGSAASSGEAFFVPSYDGFLYALSAEAGDVLWRSPVGGPIAGAPAVDSGAVVIGGPDGKVHCIEAAGGTKRWVYTTGAAVKSSIAIAGGRVFAGSNDGFVYCLDLSDGSVVWKYKTGDVVLARPLVDDGVVYAASYDGNVYAIDVSSGGLLDSFDAGGAVYSSPAGDGENLYFGTNRGSFICVSRRGEKTT